MCSINSENVLCVAGGSHGNDDNSVESFSITVGSKGGDLSFEPSKQSLLPFNHPRSDPAHVMKDDVLYVMGGTQQNIPISSCEAFNTVTNERVTMPDINHPRSYPTAVFYDDEIVVIGGADSEQLSMKSAEYFSFKTNSWEAFPPLNVPRHGHTACVMNGMIFVFGGNALRQTAGVRSVEMLRSYEVYDRESARWSLYHDLHVPKHCKAAFPI